MKREAALKSADGLTPPCPLQTKDRIGVADLGSQCAQPRDAKNQGKEMHVYLGYNNQ